MIRSPLILTSSWDIQVDFVHFFFEGTIFCCALRWTCFFWWVVFPNGKNTHFFVRRGLIQGGWFYEKSYEERRFNQSTCPHPQNMEVLYGGFLKWWCPQNTPKWSFLVGKPMVIGETHHFRNPPIYCTFFFLNFLPPLCGWKLGGLSRLPWMLAPSSHEGLGWNPQS